MDKKTQNRTEVLSLRKEISEYDIYKKVPLVFNYVLESYVLDSVPTFVRTHTETLKKIGFFGACIFSASVVPMLYIYRRDRDVQDDSLLSAE